MLLEMHAHTSEYSPCSSVSAVDLLQQVLARGLQGIVLTDHHHLWPPEDLASLRRAASVPDHFLILAGQEVGSSDFGDILVYGATQSLVRQTSARRIRQLFPDAAMVWAHPYRDGRIPSDSKLQSPVIDAIEIFNSNHTVRSNNRALQDWHRLRFTAAAGTDTHARSYAGIYPTFFDHPVHSIEELALEIRHGRCRPFLREIPRSGATTEVMEVNIGSRGADEPRERLIVKNLKNEEKWKSAARSFAVMDAIAACGFGEGPFRVPLPIDADPASFVVIEQGLRGKSLYDKLITASPAEGREFVRMAARWLARLHNCRLIVTAQGEFVPKEIQRLARYLEHFAKSGNPNMRKFQEIMEAVQEEERKIAAREQAVFVQGHGDFHPKNIFIGRDSRDDRGSAFVAAIDFESSMVLPPSFDVGCFLAQFRNQLFEHPGILQNYPESLFTDAYLESAEERVDDFMRQVELFRARTNLSIASYLINVGHGASENLWRVLVEAEQAINVYNAG